MHEFDLLLKIDFMSSRKKNNSKVTNKPNDSIKLTPEELKRDYEALIRQIKEKEKESNKYETQFNSLKETNKRIQKEIEDKEKNPMQNSFEAECSKKVEATLNELENVKEQTAEFRRMTDMELENLTQIENSYRSRIQEIKTKNNQLMSELRAAERELEISQAKEIFLMKMYLGIPTADVSEVLKQLNQQIDTLIGLKNHYLEQLK